MRKILDCSPIPNQSINNVIKARGGIKRIKLITGSNSALNHGIQPINNPTGMATRFPKIHPAITLKKLTPIYINKEPF